MARAVALPPRHRQCDAAHPVLPRLQLSGHDETFSDAQVLASGPSVPSCVPLDAVTNAETRTYLMQSAIAQLTPASLADARLYLTCSAVITSACIRLQPSTSR